MITVKVTKQGNATMIAIPDSLHVEEGEEFFIIKKNSGVISMIPKTKNPFKNAKDNTFYTPELNIDYVPSGNEVDDL